MILIITAVSLVLKNVKRRFGIALSIIQLKLVCMYRLIFPEPNQFEFFDAFIERTIKLLSYSEGHAFVLFTSHQALKKSADILSKEIDYPIFIQGQAPRSELLNQFRHTKHAVLLGTSSFWEGVDVKGEALSLVIIDKLPFASPDDPVLQARLNHFSKQGSNPFMEHQVPQAAISLKQGSGAVNSRCD